VQPSERDEAGDRLDLGHVPMIRQHPLLGLSMACLLVAGLAGCASSTSASPAPASSVLGGTVHRTSFAQVRHAIDTLYRSHPSIGTFQVQGVEYTPKTRDKVLKVCRDGSIANTAQELETERVMACAPLIYFFARYGSRASVPESTEVARQLYWYAITQNQHPYNSTKVLTDLLSTWGIK
jgi:hypothetical protein